MTIPAPLIVAPLRTDASPLSVPLIVLIPLPSPDIAPSAKVEPESTVTVPLPDRTALPLSVIVLLLVTVRFAFAILPVNVTSPSLIALSVPPVIPLSTAPAVPSKLVTLTVPLFVIVLPVTLAASTLNVVPLSTSTVEFWKSPVNVELAVNSIVSNPVSARVLKF